MRKLATIRTTARTSDGIAEAMRTGAPFTTSGSLSGGPATRDSRGYLPEEHRASLAAAEDSGTGYIIRSYGTPIAWSVDRSVWHVPNVRYSVTTSRHQSRVRFATHLAEVEMIED